MSAWDLIRGLWDERDRRYALLNRGFPRTLTPAEIAIVRTWRRIEARSLPGRARPAALLAIDEWPGR